VWQLKTRNYVNQFECFEDNVVYIDSDSSDEEKESPVPSIADQDKTLLKETVLANRTHIVLKENINF
jgi:hypothetical protein